MKRKLLQTKIIKIMGNENYDERKIDEDYD